MFTPRIMRISAQKLAASQRLGGVRAFYKRTPSHLQPKPERAVLDIGHWKIDSDAFRGSDGQEIPFEKFSPLVDYEYMEKPAVIVLHDSYGLTDEVRDHATQFARRGYETFVPDLYRGATPADAEQAATWAAGMVNLGGVGRDGDEHLLEDVNGMVEILRRGVEKWWTPIFVVGFSSGGGLALSAARHLPITAAVSFYGVPGSDAANVKDIEVPFQLHAGYKDEMEGFTDEASMDIVEKAILRNDLTVECELHRYPEVGHWFLNGEAFESKRNELGLTPYCEDTALDAWTNTFKYLRTMEDRIDYEQFHDTRLSDGTNIGV